MIAYLFHKYPENFAFQIFKISQQFTREICYLQKVQCLLFVLKRSHVCYYIICMTATLKKRYKVKNLNLLQTGLLPSEKLSFICFGESPLKIIKKWFLFHFLF